MSEPLEEPRKRPTANRERVSWTMKPATLELLEKWAEAESESVSRIVDMVVAFAARKGFRDET